MNVTKSDGTGHRRILYLTLAFLGYCGFLLWVFLAIAGAFGFLAYVDTFSREVTFAMRICTHDSRFPLLLGLGIFLTCSISVNLFLYARYRKERTLTENIVFFLPLHFAICGAVVGILQLVFLAPFIADGFPKSGTENEVLARGGLWVWALFVTATVVASIGSLSTRADVLSRFFLWGPAFLSYLPLHVAWSYAVKDGGAPGIPIFPTPRKVFISLLVVYSGFEIWRWLTKSATAGGREILASRVCFGALANAACMYWAAGLFVLPCGSVVLSSRPEDRAVQALAEGLTICTLLAVNAVLIAASVRKAREGVLPKRQMENFG